MGCSKREGEGTQLSFSTATMVVLEIAVKTEMMADMESTGERLKLAAASVVRCLVLTGLATQAASHRRADMIAQERRVVEMVASIYPELCHSRRLCS